MDENGITMDNTDGILSHFGCLGLLHLVVIVGHAIGSKRGMPNTGRPILEHRGHGLGEYGLRCQMLHWELPVVWCNSTGTSS